MHGLDCNDRLPALAHDGALIDGASPAAAMSVSPARVQGVGPALSPIVDAVAAHSWSPAAPVWVAVPSRMAPDSMGELLRQLRTAGVSVQGFVDAAVVTVAWLQKPAPVVVLDMGLHGAALSVVVRDGENYRLRRSATLATGTAHLQQLWMRLVAQSMVNQTRFDPLHDPAQEAQVRAALPALLLAAEEQGAAALTLQAEGRELSVTISRDQFVTAAEALLRPLTETLQALCAAVGDCQVMVPASLIRWPGLREALIATGSRPVWAITEGFAASAASLLPATVAAAGGAVQYLTQLAPLGAPAPKESSRRVESLASLAAATHLVFRGRAIAIEEGGLVLGRSPGEGAGHLALPEGVAGVSRRHCTLQRAGLETVLIDHSRHGTFVDGQRVHGRTLLSAGSSLRLGTPGIELPLVAVGDTRS